MMQQKEKEERRHKNQKMWFIMKINLLIDVSNLHINIKQDAEKWTGHSLTRTFRSNIMLQKPV